MCTSGYVKDISVKKYISSVFNSKSLLLVGQFI